MKYKKVIMSVISILAITAILTACNTSSENSTEPIESTLSDTTSSFEIDTTKNYNFPEKITDTNDIIIENDYIYICASRGIFKVERNGDKVTPLFTVQEGWIGDTNQNIYLHNNYLYFLYHDKESYSYYGTPSNICRIDINGNHFQQFDNPSDDNIYMSLSVTDDILTVLYYNFSEQDGSSYIRDYSIKNDPDILEITNEYLYSPTYEPNTFFSRNINRVEGSGISTQIIYLDEKLQEHIIIEDHMSNWVIRNNRIYFSQNNDIYSTDLQGNDKKRFSINEENTMYMIRNISDFKDDWLYCQTTIYTNPSDDSSQNVKSSETYLKIKCDFSEWYDLSTDTLLLHPVDNWYYFTKKDGSCWRMKVDGSDLQLIGD